jgi:hypothetical protein
MRNYPSLVEIVKLLGSSGRAEVYLRENYFFYGAIYEDGYAK